MTLELLRRVDLNLLVILNLLLQEESVTRAAQQLHLTPSAVSHALSRLRALFDDELFIRDGRRMRPTARASALGERLPLVLEQLASALARPEPFNPMSSTRRFRVAAPDFIAPLILQKIEHAAPHASVEWASTSPMAVQKLTRGDYDALIAPRALKNEGLRSSPLGEWPWMVYGRSGHPAFQRWSLEAWSAYPHLQIGTTVIGGQGPIDRKLAQLGMTRRVTAVIPHFSMAAPIIAESDRLLTVPSILMRHLMGTYPLEERALPLELPPLSLSLFRSATRGAEESVQWLLKQVEAAFHTFHAAHARVPSA